MPFLTSIRRAFVSYSRQDHWFVDTLASDLRNHAFELWVDFQGLEPGTDDWETAVRAAIAESFAFLLVASPDSRRSSYVRSELLLAQARELPIYALWAAGESWIDSIPMNLAHIQYLDFRDAAYSDSLRVLMEELSGFDAAVPKHFIYQSFYNKIRPDPKGKRGRGWFQLGDVYGFAKEPIHGAMEIQLESIYRLNKRDSLDTLFVRPNAFKTAAHLLDEIYINYLAHRYPPFSYGRQWYLFRQLVHGHFQLALDWRLLHDQLESKRSPITLMSGPPESYWFLAGSTWLISERTPPDTTVLAGERWLIETILKKPKVTSLLMDEYMKEVNAGQFSRTKRECVAVAAHLYKLPNTFYVQTKSCSAELKARWTY